MINKEKKGNYHVVHLCDGTGSRELGDYEKAMPGNRLLQRGAVVSFYINDLYYNKVYDDIVQPGEIVSLINFTCTPQETNSVKLSSLVSIDRPPIEVVNTFEK